MTAGESHGQGICVIVSGVPSGIPVAEEYLRKALTRRRLGYGRGPRMRLEADEFTITGGLRGGVTTGNPFSVIVWNTEREKWSKLMSPFVPDESERITRPRPGHADLAGFLKFGYRSIRDVIERASARETAARAVAAVICSNFLQLFGVKVIGFVTSIGNVKADDIPTSVEELEKRVVASELFCPDPAIEEDMKREIDAAAEAGDTIGGTIKVKAYNVPPGLGSYDQWFKRLDARLAMAVMSIPGIKGVEIGAGFQYATVRGSQIHDEIQPRGPIRSYGEEETLLWNDVKWFERLSNNAGGIEGGVSNGEIIELSAVMKPIPTLKKSLRTVDLSTGEAALAHYERSDVCVVPAAAYVCECMVKIVLAAAFLEKFGGDSVRDVRAAYHAYLSRLKEVRF